MTIASTLTKAQLDTLRTNPQANYASSRTQRCGCCRAILRPCFVVLGNKIDQDYDTGAQFFVEGTKSLLNKWANIKLPQHVRVRIDQPHWPDLYAGKTVPFSAQCPSCKAKLLLFIKKL